ncbi:MAG: hypothetical protein WCD82_10945, partial [Xanthobacteraceae bacterium]
MGDELAEEKIHAREAECLLAVDPHLQIKIALENRVSLETAGAVGQIPRDARSSFTLSQVCADDGWQPVASANAASNHNAVCTEWARVRVPAVPRRSPDPFTPVRMVGRPPATMRMRGLQFCDGAGAGEDRFTTV